VDAFSGPFATEIAIDIDVFIAAPGAARQEAQ
jgi:hypothetical protein